MVAIEPSLLGLQPHHVLAMLQILKVLVRCNGLSEEAIAVARAQLNALTKKDKLMTSVGMGAIGASVGALVFGTIGRLLWRGKKF